MQIINIIPERVSIADSSATNLKCDHPGVVGENDSQKNKKKKKINFELYEGHLASNKKFIYILITHSAQHSVFILIQKN